MTQDLPELISLHTGMATERRAVPWPVKANGD
jgi:hypothetical protein